MYSNQTPLTIVILTKNEESSIERVLRSIPDKYKTIVFDSFSTDRTVELAKAAGATVHQRVFDDYASQRNAALQLVETPWVLFLDADEHPNEAFWTDVGTVLIRNTEYAYKIPRRMHFMGKSLRFGRTSDSPIRMFKPSKGKYVGKIHESVVTDSPSFSLRGEVAHFSYDSLTDYFSKFNQYTSQIAERRVQEGRKVGTFGVLTRPMAEFIGRYILRGGFLDGYPGLCFAILSSMYCYVKYAKAYELQKR